MATVTIQRRKKQDGTMRYPVYFVDSLTGKKKYHGTFRTLKDAQSAANGLRDIIDKSAAPERRRHKALAMGRSGGIQSLRRSPEAAPLVFLKG